MSKDPAVVHFDSQAIRAKIDADQVQVRSFEGTEQISHLFEFQVHLACIARGGITDAEAQELLSQPAWISMTRHPSGGDVVSETKMAGMVCSVRSRAEAHHSEYFLRFVPRLWLTTLTVHSEVYLGKAPHEIIAARLAASGLAPAMYRFVLCSDYQNVWDAIEEEDRSIVQYQESDYDFICRLCEHWGLFFSFEHDDVHGDVVVFSATAESYATPPPRPIALVTRGDRMGVYAMESCRRVVPAQFAVRDYNHRNPGHDVQADTRLATAPGATGRVYDYGLHAKNAPAAKYFAQIRAQEAAVQALQIVGEADAPWFHAGTTVRIDGTDNDSGHQDVLLTEVHHIAVQPVFGFHGSGGEQPYRTEFQAIPLETPYRAALVTPKPRVHGLLTAVVNDLSPSELGAIDAEGKYDVAFMFDEKPIEKGKRASRPVRMAQPSAGDRRGLHLPLRDGTEVVVACVDGDPDRPIIVGAVPNPRTPSDVTLRNREASALVTNRTALHIDDQDPRWRIMVGDLDGDEKTVFQLGEASPGQENEAQKSWRQGVFEQGGAIATVHNFTTTANEALTTVCSTSSSFQKWRTSITVGDRVDWTGDTNPMSRWEGIAEVASNLATLSKGLGSAVAYARNLYISSLTADAARAARAAERARRLVAKGLGYPHRAPQQQNPDGTSTPTESEQAFVERALREAAGALPAGLEPAVTALQHLERDAQRAAAAVSEAERQPDLQAVQATATQIDSLATSMKEAVAVGRTVKTLYSTIGRLFSVAKQQEKHKLADKLLDWTLRTTEATDGRVKPIATRFSEFSPLMPTSPATLVGKEQPYTVVGSNHSTALLGMMNTLLFGKEQLLASSEGDVTVLGNRCVHLKSPNCVEAAAHKVKLTSERLVDVHSNGKVAIVAHSGAEAVADKQPGGVHVKQALDHTPGELSDEPGAWSILAPDDVTMLLHSQKGIKATSTDESIQATAKKNIILNAQTEDFVTTVDLGSQMTDVNMDVVTLSKLGSITTQAATGSWNVDAMAGIHANTSANVLVNAAGICAIKAEKIFLK